MSTEQQRLEDPEDELIATAGEAKKVEPGDFYGEISKLEKLHESFEKDGKTIESDKLRIWLDLDDVDFDVKADYWWGETISTRSELGRLLARFGLDWSGIEPGDPIPITKLLHGKAVQVFLNVNAKGFADPELGSLAPIPVGPDGDHTQGGP